MFCRTKIAVCLLVLVPAAQSIGHELVTYGYRVVNVYPHDSNAFTQGLFFRDGKLYESTGQYGSSSIRRVSLTTGEVLKKYDLAGQYFSEGIVDWNDRLISVTWRSGMGFVFRLDDFSTLETFRFAGEGWGLTRDNSHIIMSDGTEKLRFLDPETFAEEKTLSVSLRNRDLLYLNELEWIEGAIFANVWQSNWIVRINPDSGDVTGLVDLSGLLPESDRIPGHTDVLNGIAYDSARKRLFVTGKNWPSLFEIVLIEKTGEK
jgi:glutaminyl-peptide cyclotransferase